MTKKVFKNSTEKISFLFIFITVGITITVILISYFLNTKLIIQGDIVNWATLIVEIGIGIGIALAILIYSNSQQTKFQKQQDEIETLIKSVENMESRQEQFHKKNSRRYCLSFKF
jgi:uncharacterized membrane protein YgaE (UPF0421/DUF939 family)